MGFRYDIAIRSTHKYAVRASGDVARIIDRPDGGVALLVIDGQGSGPSARAAARDVAARLTGLLEAGADANVAAIAANQALASARAGQVSVSFDIVIANAAGDMDIARFSTNTVHVLRNDAWHGLEANAGPGGRRANAEPDLFRCSVADATALLIASDGASGSVFDRWIASSGGVANASGSATALFDEVICDQSGRPKDDVTIALMVRSEIPAEQRFEQFDYRRDVR